MGYQTRKTEYELGIEDRFDTEEIWKGKPLGQKRRMLVANDKTTSNTTYQYSKVLDARFYTQVLISLKNKSGSVGGNNRVVWKVQGFDIANWKDITFEDVVLGTRTNQFLLRGYPFYRVAYRQKTSGSANACFVDVQAICFIRDIKPIPKIRMLKQIDPTLSVFQVPEGKKWAILRISVFFVASATVGTRQITVGDHTEFHSEPPDSTLVEETFYTDIVTVTAGQARRINFIPNHDGAPRNFDTGNYLVQIPQNWVLREHDYLSVQESVGVDPTNDSMKARLWVIEEDEV